jgi:hypothetical protein
MIRDIVNRLLVPQPGGAVTKLTKLTKWKVHRESRTSPEGRSALRTESEH